jgi:pimeloyl-ACP methyl ester carboxylesterase
MPIVARRFFSSTAKTKLREEVDDDDDDDDDGDSDSDSDSDDALIPSDAKEIPWIVVGHSVGSWCAFEFVRLAASLGFHAPALACISGFPAPDIQIERRPWRVNKQLDDAAFKDECRAWGMDEAAFGEKIWPVFEPLLRADFTLFDEYEYDENSHRRGVEDEREKEKEQVFPRLLTLRGTRDERITREAVSAWRRFSFVDEKEGKKRNRKNVPTRRAERRAAPALDASRVQIRVVKRRRGRARRGREVEKSFFDRKRVPTSYDVMA